MKMIHKRIRKLRLRRLVKGKEQRLVLDKGRKIYGVLLGRRIVEKTNK